MKHPLKASGATPFLLVFLTLSAPVNAQALIPSGSPGAAEREGKTAVTDWKEETALLGRELAVRHADLFHRVDSVRFTSWLEQVARASEGSSTFQVAVRLQQVLARMGDASTRVNYHFMIAPGEILPLECYWFDDGIYILETIAGYGDLAGTRITGLNGFPLQQVIDSLATLLVRGNQYEVKASIPRMITWVPLLEHFGFSDNNRIQLESMGRNGIPQQREIFLPAGDSSIVRVPVRAVPPGWDDRNSYFRERYFRDDRTLYIQYNNCWSREMEEKFGTGTSALFMPSFRDFEKSVFRAIRKEEIDKLVIDLRFNEGGIARQGTEFIKKLGSVRNKDPWKAYTIIGRHTSSAAVINALDCRKYLNSVLVGEGTGGRPNHFGNVERFVLPRSGLVVSYSTEYYHLLPGDPPSLLPDLGATISFRDYINGIDPALECIMQQAPSPQP